MGRRHRKRRQQDSAGELGAPYNSSPTDPPTRLFAQAVDGKLLAVAYGTCLQVYDARCTAPAGMRTGSHCPDSLAYAAALSAPGIAQSVCLLTCADRTR